MNLNEYQENQNKTSPDGRKKENRLLNGALGLAGESGEVIDLIKKHIFQGHDLDPVKFVDELGDVLWYISEIASALNVDLDEIATYNVAKLKKRYPNGFDPERSKNREV